MNITKWLCHTPVRWRATLLILALIGVFADGARNPAQAQGAEIAGSVATSVVLAEIRTMAMEAIDHATAQGDYLLNRAASQILVSIDAWEAANTRLLDRAFEQLDELQRQTFNDMRSTLSQARLGMMEGATAAQDLAVLANQIVERLPRPSGRTAYVTVQRPVIVPPMRPDTLRVTLLGVNLHQADPQLRLSDGYARRALTGATQVAFFVPITELPSAPGRMHAHTLTLEHRTGGGFLRRSRQVERQIVLTTLPQNLATWTLNGAVGVKRPVEEAV